MLGRLRGGELGRRGGVLGRLKGGEAGLRGGGEAGLRGGGEAGLRGGGEAGLRGGGEAGLRGGGEPSLREGGLGRRGGLCHCPALSKSGACGGVTARPRLERPLLCIVNTGDGERPGFRLFGEGRRPVGDASRPVSKSG